MNNQLIPFLILLFLQPIALSSVAQTAIERSVLVSATVQEQPARIDFSWPADPSASGYEVFKKSLEASSWGDAIAFLPADASSFEDTDIKVGEAFEYAFFKKNFTLVRDTVCVAPGTELKFTITDMYGIGLCCSFGFGYYQVQSCDSLFAEGSDFNWQAEHTFTVCDNGTPCTPVYITLKADLFPNSTSWTLHDNTTNELLASSGAVGDFIDERPKYGFIHAGIQAPPIEDRGRILILVQEEIANDILPELETLKMDYIRDGWRVQHKYVPAQLSPQEVRMGIQSVYQEEPDLQAVFIIGHVAVPYSGNIYPDTHTEHRGAWAADTYYGEMNGNWTDEFVNITQAQFEYNHNVPGDGRFDQDSIPTDMELMVGRVDFYKLPAFNLSETELLRQYLRKAHAYKNGEIATIEKGLVDDNFNIQFGAPAASGWRNFAPMFGAANIEEVDYFTALRTQPYLWSYGCGSGSHISADGIGTTFDFANDSLQSIFTMLFGSQFGDWDNDNNFLRSAIASGNTLTNCWAGNPPYTFHQMALGQTIGYCIRRTQNSKNGVYLEGPQLVHTALMGDPGLRLHTIKPVDSLWANATGQAVELSWPLGNASLAGYHIYRSDSVNGKFQRINSTIIADTFYTDLNPIEGDNIYMVRPIKLETSGSGTYYNMSLGTLDNVFFERMVGSEEVFQDFEVALFPNPASSFIHLNTNEPAEIFECFDVNGKLILTKTIAAQSTDINISDLPNGLYFCRIRWKEAVFVRRLLVNR